MGKCCTVEPVRHGLSELNNTDHQLQYNQPIPKRILRIFILQYIDPHTWETETNSITSPTRMSNLV